MRDAGADVEPLAAPVPDDEDGAFYRADLLVTPDARETQPAQLRGARVAFNGEDSLSGWVMPRHALRELGVDPDGYVWVRTGSHHNSLRALLRGEVEAAPIDSTVLALEQRADPALASPAPHRAPRPSAQPAGRAGRRRCRSRRVIARGAGRARGERRGASGAGSGGDPALRRRGGRGLRAGAHGRRHALRLPAVAPQARDHAHALERDRRAHLRVAGGALAERERHLDDAQPGAMRALRRLDLEDVALRARRRDVDRVEGGGEPELEAAGEIGVGQPERARRERRSRRGWRLGGGAASPRCSRPSCSAIRARDRRRPRARRASRAGSRAGARGRRRAGRSRDSRARAPTRIRRDRRCRARPCQDGAGRAARAGSRPCGRRVRRCRRARRRRRSGRRSRARRARTSR